MARSKLYPGTIEKRGESWRLIQYVGNQRRTRTLRVLGRKQAEQAAREWREELTREQERRADGLPGQISVARLVKRYELEDLPLKRANTRASYTTTLKLFRQFLEEESLGDLPAHRFRKPHAATFLRYARRKPLSGRTPVSERSIQRHRAVLSAIFEFGALLELVDSNPIRRIPPPEPKTRTAVILTDDQYEQLIGAADDPALRTYVILLGETGMRSGSEALWLRWEDVDLNEGWAHVVSGRHDHFTKSGKSRWVPLTQRVVEALRVHAARTRLRSYSGERSPWVFHHERTRRHAAAGERIKSLRRAFDAAAARAGVPSNFVQHDLRHRRVTTWIAEQKPLALIKEAMGHSDIRVTMGYMHLAKEHLRALVEPNLTLHTVDPQVPTYARS